MLLLIKNANIINHNKCFNGEILIENGKIKLIEKQGTHNQKTDMLLDAKNMFVFPGGIDPHVHMHLPTAAGFSSDDFYTGSRAALRGGTTCMIDFVTPQRGESIIKALNQRKEEAKKSLIDYKLHVSPVEWVKDTKTEIMHCINNKSIKSFKVYMAYKNSIGLNNEDILKVMKTVSKAGGIVTVHAELGDEIELLRNQFADNKKLSPMYHALSRPPKMEAMAVKKVIEMAASTNCPLYIVHVSCKESIEFIRNAQLSGQQVFAETCPHYLLLNDECYNGNFEQTAPYVLSPPLRKKEDQDALWEAVIDGTIQTIGTDHCPFTIRQKEAGKEDFRKIPNGAGSIEHRLSLLYTYGVHTKKISLNKFVELISTNAAKIFGIFPAKGIIEEGADADLVIWNPNIKNTISSVNHQMNCDNDIYDGFSTTGAPEHIICSGEYIYSRENDTFSKTHYGVFLK